MGGLQHERAQHHGHALRDGGLELADLRPEAAGAVLLHHDERGAHGEHRHERGQLEVGMAGGHGGEQAVVLRQRDLPVAIQAAEQDVRMREHHALRARGGAGREDDLGRVVGAQRAHLVELGRRLGAQPREVVQGPVALEGGARFFDALDLVVVRARHQHALGAIRAAVAHGAVQAEELRLNHRARGLGTLEHERGFLHQVLLVHGHHDGADLRQPEQAHHELGARAQLHGHALASRDPHREEHVGRPVDLLVERAIRVRAGRTRAIAEEEELALAARGHEAVPQAAHRFVSHDVGQSSHLFHPSIPW